MDRLLEKATRQHTKDHNSQLILRTIYDHDEISRAELARLTRLTPERLTWGLVALGGLVTLWNAVAYPPGAGYDAASHKEYADFLIQHHRLPFRNETPEYYSPPLYYALAGAATWVGRQIGLGEPHKLGQLLNVPVVVATALLVAFVTAFDEHVGLAEEVGAIDYLLKPVSAARLRETIERAQSEDARIRAVRRESNGGIVAASNDALALSEGEFVALLDHDDKLHRNALALVDDAIEAEPEADYVYTDEDKIDRAGRHSTPFFKPDWSPERMRTQMYTCHLIDRHQESRLVRL